VTVGSLSVAMTTVVHPQTTQRGPLETQFCLSHSFITKG